MKNESLKLVELLKEIVSEVGDLKNISSYPYRIKKGGGWFYFEYGDNKYKVGVELHKVPKHLNNTFGFPPIIDHLNRPIVNIGFDVEGSDTQYLKAGYDILVKIITTVVNIVKDSISNYPDNSIFTLVATSKTGGGFNDPQKMRLYKLVLQQNLPSGYRMGDGKYLYYDSLFLTKK